LLRRRERKVGSRLKLAGGLLLVGFALSLVVVGRIYPAEVADVRMRLAGPLASILRVLQAPLEPLSQLGQRYSDYMNMQSELARLRNENEELKGWQWRAVELERQLADLSALSKVVSEPGLDYVTSRVVARSIGAHSRSALIGAGRGAGVRAGAAVLNQRGLVGSTYEVGPGTSRVRLLTDKTSRILVSIGRGLVTAEAEGAGDELLDIRDGGRMFDVAVGDEVRSAGEPGGVPRGLRIGRVVGSAKGMRIEPYVDFDRLDFVSVLVPAGLASEARGSGRETGGDEAHLTAHLNEEAEGGSANRVGGGPVADRLVAPSRTVD